ncbi:MAG: hypothetical protein ACT4PL_12700 [Phycisphaerales bacterium]
MMRAVLSVILAYLAMVVVVMIGNSAAYFALGVDRVFEPGNFTPTMWWIGATIVVGMVSALVGGVVCAAIAKKPTPPKVLAVLVLVLACLGGVAQMLLPQQAEQPVREPGVSMIEAASKTHAPVWYNFAIGVIGFVGVMIGSQFSKRPRG